MAQANFVTAAKCRFYLRLQSHPIFYLYQLTHLAFFRAFIAASSPSAARALPLLSRVISSAAAAPALAEPIMENKVSLLLPQSGLIIHIPLYLHPTQRS